MPKSFKSWMQESLSQRREQHESATVAEGNCMWFLFQGLIMTPIIGSNGAYHWAPKGGSLPWR
jgi:hypothetical protein